MGIKDYFLRPKKEDDRPLNERLLTDRVWGDTFLAISEIYEAFDSAGLADQDRIIFILKNDEFCKNVWKPAYTPEYFKNEIGVDAPMSFSIEDYGKRIPSIEFDTPADEPLIYKSLMEALKGKGEHNGWDSLYNLQFTFRWKEPGLFGSNTFASCTPHGPRIETDPTDSRRFIISADKWTNIGSWPHTNWGPYCN